jgi:hypothetical protein
MKQPGLGLSAFSLPKLKRDVAAKMLPNMRDGGNSQPGSSTDAAAADAHSKQQLQGMQQQISKGAEAGTNNENVDPSSPSKAATKAAASKQPATARKGRRTKQQTRVSEQHTVYYDVMGSPEDAHTRAQHNSHAASRLAAAAAAAATAPSSVHGKPARRAVQQASGAELDTSTAADADAGGLYNAQTDADLFGSQPEPMDEDHDPYGTSAELHATAGDPHSLKARTPAPPAAAGRKQARTTQHQQQQQHKEQAVVPRPNSRQQRHAAAAAAASKQAAEAAAASDPDTDEDTTDRQQQQQQQGRVPRGRGPASAQEAAGILPA